ncbi:MAG: hypothetical protein MR013_07400 [Prevotella sp.]|nr:hypothetical protein [Prevotella sp.]
MAEVCACRGACGAVYGADASACHSRRYGSHLRLADERMAQNDFHRALQYYKQVADALGGATCHDERLECLKALYGCSEACFRIND